jgi:hypothetical protein
MWRGNIASASSPPRWRPWEAGRRGTAAGGAVDSLLFHVYYLMYIFFCRRQSSHQTVPVLFIHLSYSHVGPYCILWLLPGSSNGQIANANTSSTPGPPTTNSSSNARSSQHVTASLQCACDDTLLSDGAQHSHQLGDSARRTGHCLSDGFELHAQRRTGSAMPSPSCRD